MVKPRFLRDPAIDDLRERLTHHLLYEELKDLQALRTFMEHHVFAVWDFMSVVKSLQHDLTSVGIPWVPPEDAEAARLINEIVLGEESDAGSDGSVASHYHLYLEAMQEVGADTSNIEQFVREVVRGVPVVDALDVAGVPLPARKFVNETFSAIVGTPLHVRTAVLFHGREDLIPTMFKPMVERMRSLGKPCGKFLYYLERHIEVDSAEHAIWAESLLRRLCADDKSRQEETRQIALKVLRSRLAFWDAIREVVRFKAVAEID